MTSLIDMFTTKLNELQTEWAVCTDESRTHKLDVTIFVMKQFIHALNKSEKTNYSSS